MGCKGKQVGIFIALLTILALAGCGSSKETGKKEKERSDPYDPPIVVQGFRVQLFSTSEIDEANARKTKAEAAFPDEWFFIVYDAPTYKVRGGNFVNRSSADAFAKHLTEKGFPDAWTVPEKIIKNPRPRTKPHPESQK